MALNGLHSADVLLRNCSLTAVAASVMCMCVLVIDRMIEMSICCFVNYINNCDFGRWFIFHFRCMLGMMHFAMVKW